MKRKVEFGPVWDLPLSNLIVEVVYVERLNYSDTQLLYVVYFNNSFLKDDQKSSFFKSFSRTTVAMFKEKF